MEDETSGKNQTLTKHNVDMDVSTPSMTSVSTLEQRREQELLQLIGQYLCSKGYKSAYSELTKVSGIKLEHESATKLRDSILEGRWDDAEAALNQLCSFISEPKYLAEVTFLLLEQRFLEHLEANEIMPAVFLLRNRITPMNINRERVHLLASCLMCRTEAEICAQAGWLGVKSGSRVLLIERIQRFMPPRTMLPPRRLEILLNDSLKSQIRNCVFHNKPLPCSLDDISLLDNHTCKTEDFPMHPVQRVGQREYFQSESELWMCQFSPNGLFLITGGKEANVVVWRVDVATRSVRYLHSVQSQPQQTFMCWAPDSSKFAVCFGEEQSRVSVFDPNTGLTICSQKVHDEDTFSAATFFADSRTLAFGGMKGTFYIMDTLDEGRILTMVEGYRVQSMVAVIRMNQAPAQPNEQSTEAGAMSGTGGAGDGATDLPPGGPDATGTTPNEYFAESLSPYDELLVADSMHRVCLFKFGYAKAQVDEQQASGTQLPVPAVPPTEGTGRDVYEMLLSAPGAPHGQALSRRSLRQRPIYPSNVYSLREYLMLDQHLQQQQLLHQLAAVRSSSTGGEINLFSDPAVTSGYSSSNMYLPLVAAAAVSASSLASPGNTETTSLLNYSRPMLRPARPRASGLALVQAAAQGSSTGSSSLVDATTQNQPAFSNRAVSTATSGNSVAAPSGDASSVQEATVNGNGADELNNYALREQVTLFKENHAIQSLALAKSGRQVLVTLHEAGLHLWDLDAAAILQRFVGAKQKRLKLMSSMGGVNDDFVASGSEDGRVHFWRVNSGPYPICSALQHPSTVTDVNINCVHWNPAVPDMLASVSDLGELCIWAPQKYEGLALNTIHLEMPVISDSSD